MEQGDNTTILETKADETAEAKTVEVKAEEKKSKRVTLESRVEELEKVVARIKELVKYNDQPVNLPKQFENLNPDYLPSGGKPRGL